MANVSPPLRPLPPPWLLSMSAGLGAGAIAAVFTAPLDVIRVRLQVQGAVPAHGKPLYRGVVRSLLVIARREGLRGLFRGLGTNMLALGPNWAVYFACYDQSKHYFSELTELHLASPYVHIASAATAALCTDLVANPLWLIKTRLQTQVFRSDAFRYRGPLHAAISIVRQEGFFTLWNGLTAQMLGVVHVCIQFPLYEHLKRELATHRTPLTSDNGSATSLPPRSVPALHDLNLWELIVASSVSKMIASTAAYPHEVLRSRLHYQRTHDHNPYTSLWSMTRRIVHEEGFRALYHGCGTNLVRTVPAAAITLTSYEYLMRLFGPGN